MLGCSRIGTIQADDLNSGAQSQNAGFRCLDYGLEALQIGHDGRHVDSCRIYMATTLLNQDQEESHFACQPTYAGHPSMASLTIIPDSPAFVKGELDNVNLNLPPSRPP